MMDDDTNDDVDGVWAVYMYRLQHGLYLSFFTQFVRHQHANHTLLDSRRVHVQKYIRRKTLKRSHLINSLWIGIFNLSTAMRLTNHSLRLDFLLLVLMLLCVFLVITSSIPIDFVLFASFHALDFPII